ncbi:MAG: mecR [Planctomycetaceae bacterium]|nr:mecR [Planctomycetaceae bacterium]
MPDRLSMGTSPAVTPELVPGTPRPSVLREQFTATTPTWAALIGTLLCVVWFVGAGVGLGRAFYGFLRFRQWLKSVSIVESTVIASSVRLAEQAVGLKTHVPLYRSNLLPAPVTCGLFRPRIVVPAGIEVDLSFDQLRAVIQHEVAHIARRDLWTGLLQQVALILYWWNPVVRLANRHVSDLREQICDDIAVGDSPHPDLYAATLIAIAERCSHCVPIPATLGFGSPPASQLEHRIRRILSNPQTKYRSLERRPVAGVLAAAMLMTATIVCGQVQLEPRQAKQADVAAEISPAKPAVEATKPTSNNPSLDELIQRMADYEKAYLPFQIKSMETFRMADGLTLQQKSRYPWADGRKHQRLMEYAQLEQRIWRKKETHLIDDEAGRSIEFVSDGKRKVQVSPASVTMNGETKTEYYISTEHIWNYLTATPIQGVLCMATFPEKELFTETVRKKETEVQLTWEQENARLNCIVSYPEHPDLKRRVVLTLSRKHDWYPIRVQRFNRAEETKFIDEWEATKLVQLEQQWRVVEGSHRYTDYPEERTDGSKVVYSVDFKVLEQKFGSDVSQEQFHVQIPEGATVRTKEGPTTKPAVEPAKTREITVRTVDLAGQPIPKASVRLRATTEIRELDSVTSDEQGVAHSAKAPAGMVLVEVHAEGFRSARVVLGGGPELKMILVPITSGTTVDETGNPINDAWITNEQLFFRADGMVTVRSNFGSNRQMEAWSTTNGEYQLKSSLTVRKAESQIPFAAIDPTLEKMAIAVVPAGELHTPQKLVLRPVTHVKGHCLLEGVKESVPVGISVETSKGIFIGQLTTKHALTPDGLRVDFELRIPAGEYVLKSRKTPEHAGFDFPLAVPVNQKEMNLGTRKVPPADNAVDKK